MTRKPKTILYARFCDLDQSIYDLFNDIYTDRPWGKPPWKEYHTSLQLIEDILFDE